MIKGEASLKTLQQVEEQCEEPEKILEEREKKKKEVGRESPIFFVASVELARSIADQLFSICWRAGICAKN